MFAKTSKDRPAEAAPKTRLDDYEEYNTPLAKLYAMRRRRAGKQAEIAAELVAMSQKKKGSAPDVSEQIRLVADGADLPDFGPPPESPSNRLHREEYLFAQAERVLEAEVEAVTELLSAKISANVADLHEALVQDVAVKLAATAAAVDKEEAFRDDLADGGVRFSAHIHPMPMPGVGSLRDDNSRASMWLREAIEMGLIDAGHPGLEPYHQARALKAKKEAESRATVQKGVQEFQAREKAKLAADVAETKKLRAALKPRGWIPAESPVTA